MRGQFERDFFLNDFVVRRRVGERGLFLLREKK
jgi:hypothetical protein